MWQFLQQSPGSTSAADASGCLRRAALGARRRAERPDDGVVSDRLDAFGCLRRAYVGRLLVLVLALVGWSLLVGQVEAGCGSYITVGNWQQGAKQNGLTGLAQSGLKIAELRGGRLLIPGSLTTSSGHMSDLPGECRGPNCSRQTPAPKVPVTYVPLHSLPELMLASAESWVLDLSASGWLTDFASRPFYRTSSILRPPQCL